MQTEQSKLNVLRTKSWLIFHYLIDHLRPFNAADSGETKDKQKKKLKKF